MNETPIEHRRLLFEAHMDAPDGADFAGGQASLFSRRSPASEGRNQDCAALLPLGDDSGLLVVADGVGGGKAGADASIVAVHELIDSLESHLREGATSRREAILTALKSASREIATLGVGAGTTVALAEVEGRAVRPYHVGDSCVLVVGQQGKIKHLTVPHSPVGYAVEAGLLNESEAMHHADRHLIFNMVGTVEMRIEVGPRLELSERDTLLLYSDGLADNLRVQEIVELVRSGPLQESVTALADLARKRMASSRAGEPQKPDDLTIVGWRANS